MLLILAFLVLVGGIYLLIKMKKRLEEHERILLIISMFLIISFCFVIFYAMYTSINDVDAYDYEKLDEKLKINEWTELIEDRLSDEPELVEILKEHLETEKSYLNEEEERMLVLKKRKEAYSRWIWPIK